MSRLKRGNLAGVAILCCLAAISPAGAEPASQPNISFYGTPGLIDMPTAYNLPDGELSLTTSHFGPTLHNTLTFQITPRLSGSFRYSIIDDFAAKGTLDKYDRSFDFSYLLMEETTGRPAVSVGIRDFVGTGIYSSEYLVASKRLTPRLRGTVGIGWGRLGSYNSFSNPLGIISDKFKTRPIPGGGSTTGGEFEIDAWFRGDAALFGGLEWQVTDSLTFTAEYSSDNYALESAFGLINHRSPFNFGLSYRFRNGVDLGVYTLYGSEIGARLSFHFNPVRPRVPGGREGAPPPIMRRGPYGAQAASWGLDGGKTTVRQRVAAGLREQNLELEALSLSGTSASLRLKNDHYDAEAQAIGRAARVLTRTMPASVQTFQIIPVKHGVQLSAITIRRADLEELEFAPDGSWQSYVRADIADAQAFHFPKSDFIQTAYPDFTHSFNGYFTPSLFDPDNPLRADIGIELNASVALGPKFVLSAKLRQPIIGNLDHSTRLSDSVLPHVRSDGVLYDKASDLEISHLTAEYFFRPGRNFYGRVTAGYLERMYGGLSGEVLWKPVDSRLALGAEINYVRQREFDVQFEFRNYNVVTGHASAYYDFGNGFHGQIDVGRYLAKDWGATFTLDREFRNGWRIGAFFTLTDVSFDDFGEGAFDKGIRISVPLSWLTGEPSQKGFGTTIRPITRDGGARLDVRNRLYGVVRGYHDQSLNNRWGRFWR